MVHAEAQEKTRKKRANNQNLGFGVWVGGQVTRGGRTKQRREMRKRKCQSEKKRREGGGKGIRRRLHFAQGGSAMLERGRMHWGRQSTKRRNGGYRGEKRSAISIGREEDERGVTYKSIVPSSVATK